MKKSELFTKEMLESFKCHPYAEAPRRRGQGVCTPINGSRNNE